MNAVLETLFAFMIVLSIVLFAFELASYLTYGRILKTKIVNQALDVHIPKGAELNPFEDSIINIGDMPYITNTKSILGMYYISGVGRILTFSSAHNRISKLHKQLLAETRKETIEELLKIKK
jgi:hypothetical protein